MIVRCSMRDSRLSPGEPWKSRLGGVNGGSLGRKHESWKVADDAPSSGFGIAATFPDYKRVIVPFDDIDAAQSFGIFNAGYGRHRITPANIGRAITSGPNIVTLF
jgi:hypothetical protein